ncbi:hypothetical protein ACFLXI_10190 [Chloroflexota bacterium]
MYKLMIIIPPHIEEPVLTDGWPEFLHAAESMPDLQREASVRVSTSLYGTQEIGMVHELFFETLADLQSAMQSPEGLAAGQIIQQLTQGQMTLLIAEHREDDIENLRQYRQDD